jgi:hypothetical protein
MAVPSGDRFANVTGGISDPGWDAFAVTPSNSTNFTATARALYIGGIGDVTVVTANGNVVTFAAVPTGTILPIRCSRVNSTLTTATSIVGLI